MVRVKGEKTVVGVVTDAAIRQVPGLEALDERDSDGFMEWLGDFARDYGVEAIVTDDLRACLIMDAGSAGVSPAMPESRTSHRQTTLSVCPEPAEARICWGSQAA